MYANIFAKGYFSLIKIEIIYAQVFSCEPHVSLLNFQKFILQTNSEKIKYHRFHNINEYLSHLC